MEILPQLLINALIAGSIYALVSAGLSLSYGLLKILNFAHGHLMMAGVYLFYLGSVELGWSEAPSALLVAAGMVFLSFISLKVFISPFLRFNPVLSFLTTLSMATIIESLVSIAFGVNVKALNPGDWSNSIEIYGVFITPIQILIIASSLVILTILALTVHHTGFGRRLRAISENSSFAESLAVSQRRITGYVFTVSLLIAAWSGILIGYETNLQPTMGTSYTIKAFAATVFGGLGNIWGAIVGSYFLGLVENLSIGLEFGGYSIPAGYKDAVAFIMILLMLLVRPQGLFGRKRRSV